MQISRPYTVVLPSLQVDPSEREFDGRRFCLMIKLYPEGTLTPTLNPVVAGEFHNFQHSPSVLGGLLPPWVFKSKTMSLKLWLTVKEFSLLKKICINDEKLVHLYGSIISKFFLSHLAVRGANLFQGTWTIANVKVFFIWSWFIGSHCKKCSWRKFSLLKFFYRQQIFPNLFTIFTILFLRWHPPSHWLLWRF